MSLARDGGPVNEKELEYCDKLVHKSRDLGFTWGTLAVAVPFVAFMLLNLYVVEGDYVTWVKEHRLWVGLMVGSAGLWLKGIKYVGVERHDPKRKKNHE